MPPQEMSFALFLNQVIDDGLAEVKEVYDEHDPREMHKLAGAIAGFELCRDKDVDQLAALLVEQRGRTARYRQDLHQKYDVDVGDHASLAYWQQRFCELQVEWVCNVVSCALAHQGAPPIVTPTARAMVKCATILGRGDADQVQLS